MHILFGHVVAELPQRREVVKNPEGTAVGCDHQIVVLHDQVVDRRRRQIQLQGRQSPPSLKETNTPVSVPA